MSDTTKTKRFGEALNHGLHVLMETDERVVVLGEDILDPYGGAFKITKGLSSKYPERVHTTPISEGGIVGIANGLAIRGYRPVVEIMFGDFLTLAADQLINHAAKFRWMFDDKVTVPLVVRTPMGARRGYGPTHSQSLEKHFFGVPGLWVVSPHILGDASKLLQQVTLECDDPVLFIENKISYGHYMIDDVSGMDQKEYKDATNPFASLLLKHKEADADGLMCCYGGMVNICLETIEKLKADEGLHIDLLVLSQLSPCPSSHLEAIGHENVYSHYFYVEEASTPGGWSSDIMANMVEALSDSSDESISHMRIGSKFEPIASSRELEYSTLPQVESLAEQVVNAY